MSSRAWQTPGECTASRKHSNSEAGSILAFWKSRPATASRGRPPRRDGNVESGDASSACPTVWPKFRMRREPASARSRSSRSSPATMRALNSHCAAISLTNPSSRERDSPRPDAVGCLPAARFFSSARNLTVRRKSLRSPAAPCLTASHQPAVSSRAGSVASVPVSTTTARGWWKAPTRFLPACVLTPVLPPTDESICARSVVGACRSATPRR